MRRRLDRLRRVPRRAACDWDSFAPRGFVIVPAQAVVAKWHLDEVMRRLSQPQGTGSQEAGVSKKASQARARGRRTAAGQGMVTVRNVNHPGRSTRVNGAKYAAMRKALLRALPARPPGLTQAEMFKAVLEYLPASLFPKGATAGWWAKTAQLDLEAKGLVRRTMETGRTHWYRSR